MVIVKSAPRISTMLSFWNRVFLATPTTLTNTYLQWKALMHKMLRLTEQKLVYSEVHQVAD